MRLKLIGFAGLLIAGLACKKSDTSTTFTGKIILASCGTVAVQIDGTTGGSNWINSGASYTNAAAIGNYCYVRGLGIRAGDNVSFKIVTNNPQPSASCVVELCLAQSPSNTIYVKDMVKTGP